MILLMCSHPDKGFLDRLNLPISLNLNEHIGMDNLEDASGLFIDWVPKLSVYEDAWFSQASILQKLIKTDIPIVIFDRSFSLEEEEVKWLKKHNVYLFEPALNSGRNGFQYLPEWVQSFEIAIDDEDREYDLVYSHHEIEYHIKGFDKWFKDYGRLFPDKRVAYSTMSISDFKKEDYKNNNLIHVEHPLIFDEGYCTVAIDKDKMYEMGYFNPMYFHAMNLGCLPLLPSEHKYFHGMFKGIVVDNLKELDYYVSAFKHVKNVVIEEIFERIKKDWSEFTIEYAVDTIRNCYE